MVRLSLHRVGPKLELSDFAKFRADCGIDLDRDFEEFLVEANGGVCNPVLRSPLLRYPVHFFAGLYPSEDLGLRRLWREFGSIDRNGSILPFASTTGSQWICLDSTGYGISVFADVPEGEFQLQSLSISFREFLRTLEPEPSVTDEVEKLSMLPWNQLRELLVRSGQQDFADSSGRSLLFNCIRNKNVESSLELIRYGASLEGVLSVAVGNNNKEIVLELIAHGADPEEALEYAVGPSRSELRKILQQMVS